MSTLHNLRKAVETRKVSLNALVHNAYMRLFADNAAPFTAVDGGAYEGFHARRMLALPGAARVVAVEAHPRFAAALREAFAATLAAVPPRLEIVEAVLQDDPGAQTAKFLPCTSSPGRSTAPGRNPDRPTIWTGRSDTVFDPAIDVPATTLDRLIPHGGAPVRLIKLHLAGAEIAALRGAFRLMALDRPVIVFENSVNAPAVHGMSFEALGAFLAGLDYRLLDMTGAPLTAETRAVFTEVWAAPRETAPQLAAALAATLKERGV